MRSVTKKLSVSTGVAAATLLGAGSAAHASGYDPGSGGLPGTGSGSTVSLLIGGAIAVASGVVLTTVVRRRHAAA